MPLRPLEKMLPFAMRILPRLLLAAVLPIFLPAMSVIAAPDTVVETNTLYYQVTYQIGNDTFEGCVFRPAKVTGKVPGVLVAHDWTGYGPFVKARAEQLAEQGYIAFALDMYGKGVHANNPQEAQKLSGAFYQDASLFRVRSKAALDELLKQPDVDPARIGAIGFCFGGATVLELARSGANVEGVVTFHGSLATKDPAKPGDIKAKEILVLHGSQDPMVKPEAVAGFMDEMNKVKEPFRLVAYPEAVHAFTNPEAGNDPGKGTAYNPQAAEAAYGEMTAFFTKLFGQ